MTDYYKVIANAVYVHKVNCAQLITQRTHIMWPTPLTYAISCHEKVTTAPFWWWSLGKHTSLAHLLGTIRHNNYILKFYNANKFHQHFYSLSYFHYEPYILVEWCVKNSWQIIRRQFLNLVCVHEIIQARFVSERTRIILPTPPTTYAFSCHKRRWPLLPSDGDSKPR